MNRTITEPARKTPIRGRYDAIICGGGTTGTVAALAAARGGLSVALVEACGFCGGTATASGVNGIGGWQYDLDGQPLISGIPMEIMRNLAENDGASSEQVAKLSTPVTTPNYRDGGLGCFWIRVNPEIYKVTLDRMLVDAGVKLFYHASTVEPLMEGESVVGALMESKSGREALIAPVVIDCTGDGDIAARAGIPYDTGRPGDNACQPMSTLFSVAAETPPQLRYGPPEKSNSLAANRYAKAVSLARERGEITRNPNDILCAATPVSNSFQHTFSVNFTRIQNHSAIDVEKLTAAEIEGREQVMEAVRFMRRYVKGSENAELVFLPPKIGIRESRRIHGRYRLTGDDILNARHFPDSICRGIYLLDIHNPTETGAPSVLKLLDEPYSIPYRCLIPERVSGLLVAGRCISGDHEALASYRVQSHCMALGEAAGTAAALSVSNQSPPDTIDTGELRDLLTQAGANTGERQ